MTINAMVSRVVVSAATSVAEETAVEEDTAASAHRCCGGSRSSRANNDVSVQSSQHLVAAATVANSASSTSDQPTPERSFASASELVVLHSRRGCTEPFAAAEEARCERVVKADGDVPSGCPRARRLRCVSLFCDEATQRKEA